MAEATVPHVTGTTRLYGIVGDPVAHVRTPMAFNADFVARGIDAICLPLQVGRDDLATAWPGLKALRNLDGFIVTAPHKAEAARLCDRLVEDGLHVGVANAVRREADGTYTGTLLDGRGFVNGLRAKGHEPAGRRIYLAGAGGAGHALAFALAAAGAAAITIHNRTRGRAEDLASHLQAAYPGCAVRAGGAGAGGHDIAVNATALGLAPDDAHAFDLASVDPAALVAEVVMMPRMTPLLIAAERRGLRIHPGTAMLEGQLAAMMQFFGLTRSGQEIPTP